MCIQVCVYVHMYTGACVCVHTCACVWECVYTHVMSLPNCVSFCPPFCLDCVHFFWKKKGQEEKILPCIGGFYCSLDHLAAGAGNGKVDVVILDPHGRKDTVRPSVQPIAGKEAAYMVEYVGMDQGLHSVNVFFAGSQIPNSPFGVQIAPRKWCFLSRPMLWCGEGVVSRGRCGLEAWDWLMHAGRAFDSVLVCLMKQEVLNLGNPQ